MFNSECPLQPHDLSSVSAHIESGAANKSHRRGRGSGSRDSRGGLWSVNTRAQQHARKSTGEQQSQGDD